MREHRLRREVGVVQRRTMPIALERKLSPVQPRTMVEQAADAIVSAAARGIFLPGDRLVEAEIARELTISRVPVREALRLLESHGVVVATPYKGMRLAELTSVRVRDLNSVRKTLQIMASHAAHDRTDAAPDWSGLRRIVDGLKEAASGGDLGATIQLEAAFHCELVRLSGNSVLSGLWQSLSKQVMMLGALTRTVCGPEEIARRHEVLLEALEKGGAAELDAAWSLHLDWLDTFDVEAALEELRKPKRGR